MVNSTISDLPPAYYTLKLSSVELTVNIESHDTELLIGNSFDNRDARNVFTLKVLSIVLLQTIAVGVVLVIFASFGIHLSRDLIGVAVVAYLITMLVMVFMDQVQKRNIYNYVILVYYPFMITFVITMLPTLFQGYNETESSLRQTLFSTWMSYIEAVLVTLLFSIFSLHSKYEFKLGHKMFMATFAFFGSYVGSTIPLYVIAGAGDPFSAFCVTLFLYLYYLYVLYAIDAMTRSDYRHKMTPGDYVTGAVNLQIDFLFIVLYFITRNCHNDGEDEE